jgi:hypothetical protein
MGGVDGSMDLFPRKGAYQLKLKITIANGLPL